MANKTPKHIEIKTQIQNCQKHDIVDISLIEYNLSLSPEERLLNHQRALDTVNELLKAREQVYGELKSSSETTT